MSCIKCKKKAEQSLKVDGKNNNTQKKDKKSLPEKILNFLFRIFVFLFLIGLIIPIIIPLTITLIFNVIFVKYSFDIVGGIREIIKYLENKFNFSFKDRDDFDEEDDYNEDEWEIDENEVTIIDEKEKK
jgi:uncharacterized membrane protein